MRLKVLAQALLLVGTAAATGVVVAPVGSSRLLRAQVAGEDVPGAATSSPQSGSRLKARLVVGADGSREQLGWYDSARGENCAFAIAADGAWRCLPSGAPAGRFFADNACTQPVAVLDRGCAAGPYAVLHVPSSCPGEAVSRVFQLGPPLSGPLVYQVAGAACAPVSAADLWGRDLYAVGDEVAPGAFVAGSEQIAP